MDAQVWGTRHLFKNSPFLIEDKAYLICVGPSNDLAHSITNLT